MLFTGWEVHIVKNCDRDLENAPLGLRYGPTLSRKMTYLFFSCGKLAYKSVCLHNFVTELAYVPSTNHCKKSNERRSE